MPILERCRVYLEKGRWKAPNEALTREREEIERRLDGIRAWGFEEALRVERAARESRWDLETVVEKSSLVGRC